MSVNLRCDSGSKPSAELIAKFRAVCGEDVRIIFGTPVTREELAAILVGVKNPQYLTFGIYEPRPAWNARLSPAYKLIEGR
jgi:hypothetical protein